MIRYALGCDKNHTFDSWFKSAAAYDSLSQAGMVACPDCGSTKVEKKLMTPGVQTSRRAETRDAAPQFPTEAAPLSAPRDEREAALAELRRQVEANSEYVGMSFAAEARAIHVGDAPERAIWGEAKPDEAKALIEDGIQVMPLPFIGRGRSN